MRVGERPEEGPEEQGCPGVYSLEGRACPGAAEQAAPGKAGQAQVQVGPGDRDLGLALRYQSSPECVCDRERQRQPKPG